MSVAAGSRREQAAREARSCDELAEAHQIAYSFWVLLERVMAIAGLIAAGVVAVKLFGQAEEGTSEWRIAAYLSVIAAVCSGFNVFLSTSKLSERHDMARKRFKSVARKFRDFNGAAADADKEWKALRKTQDEESQAAIGVGMLARSLAAKRVPKS
jgi:hypothetical protein